MFTTLDVDQSGTFDIDEFREFFRSCLRLQEASLRTHNPYQSPQGLQPAGVLQPPTAAAMGPLSSTQETPSFGGPESATVAGAVPYVVGESVQTYSRSQGEWLDAVIAEIASEPRNADGLHLPAGAIKVSWDKGTLFKWLHPRQFDAMLRRPGPAAGTMAPADPLPAPAALGGGVSGAGGAFAKGDKVQVYSSSQRVWLDATVEAVFPTGGAADGLRQVPPGTVKVVAGEYEKWVTPDQFHAMLRWPGQLALSAPAAAVGGAAGNGAAAHAAAPVLLPGGSPKERLGALLRDRSLFERLVSAVFTAHADGAAHMDPSKFAAGLKGIMDPIDPGRPFQEDRVADIFRLADGNHSGAVNQAEFGQFVRRMLEDVYRTM